MEFRIIEYNSDEYAQMVNLRTRVLKEPFDIPFSDEEKEADKKNILLGAFFPNGGDLVGCCLLTPLSDRAVKLRQMAVDFFYHKKGLGSLLIDFAEQMALERGYSIMYLHARKTALDFYKKQGYTIEEDEFIEVGLPHFGMMKLLEQNI